MDRSVRKAPRCQKGMVSSRNTVLARPKGPPETVDMETAERRNLGSLPFIQKGNGANALVFIHGFLDDGSFWRSTIQALETRNLVLVTLDLPGMGKAADDPGPFSLDRLDVVSTRNRVTRASTSRFDIAPIGRLATARIQQLRSARCRSALICGLSLYSRLFACICGLDNL